VGEELLDWIIGASMFGVMFAMGLTLTIDDFRRVAGNPRATLVGTVLQLIVMPIIGIGLARAFGLPPILTAGLVVVAACPGGMFSNMYVYLAKGHTALSVTLTATATLVSLFTLPLWVRVALVSMPGNTAAVEMPVLDTALRLGGLTVLPVAVGMVVRIRRPDALRWERRLSLSSAMGVVVGAVSQGASRPDFPLEQFAASIPPVLAFSAAAIVVGILVPALFRLPARDTVTIAVEMIVKNTLLGMVLVGQALEFEAMIPIFAFAAFQTPGGILLLVGWRWLARHGYLEHEPAIDSAAEEGALEAEPAVR